MGEMLIILLMGNLEFEVEPSRYYAVLIQVHRSTDPIVLSIEDTSWRLFNYFSFHYTIFHTENLRRSTIAFLNVSKDDIAGITVVESDTVITLNAPDSIEYSMKLYTPTGIFIFPGPTARLDSVMVLMEGRPDGIIRIGKSDIEQNLILPLIIMSGEKNTLKVFGEGSFKIMVGKVLPLP